MTFFPDIFSVFNLLSPSPVSVLQTTTAFYYSFSAALFTYSPSCSQILLLSSPLQIIFFSGMCFCLFSYSLPLWAVLVIPIVFLCNCLCMITNMTSLLSAGCLPYLPMAPSPLVISHSVHLKLHSSLLPQPQCVFSPVFFIFVNLKSVYMNIGDLDYPKQF